MNWRIVVPVVIVLGVLGYIVYETVTRPVSRDIQQSLPVTMRRFARCIHKERGVKGLDRYCSPQAIEQCRRLLAELAKREKGNPNFRFERFRINAQTTVSGSQTTSVELIDGNRNVFLVLTCRVAQLPDKTWRISDVAWGPLVSP